MHVTVASKQFWAPSADLWDRLPVRAHSLTHHVDLRRSRQISKHSPQTYTQVCSSVCCVSHGRSKLKRQVHDTKAMPRPFASAIHKIEVACKYVPPAQTHPPPKTGCQKTWEAAYHQ